MSIKYDLIVWNLYCGTEIFNNRERNRCCMSFWRQIKWLDVYKTTKYSLKDHKKESEIKSLKSRTYL